MGADFGGLIVAMVAGVVVGLAMLGVLYKTIDGEIPALGGIGAMVGLVFLLLITIKPPHPVIPAVVLVVIATLMAFFPYALGQLERAELHGFSLDQLEKAYAGFRSNPENVPVRLEVARQVYEQGLPHHAIAIAESTLDGLSKERDAVWNRSLRDQFRNEDARLAQWKRLNARSPLFESQLYCSNCREKNELSAIVCAKCGDAYLLALGRKGDIPPRMIVKLLAAWTVLACYLVLAAWIGFALSGVPQVMAFMGGIVGVGLVIAILFRRPRPA